MESESATKNIFSTLLNLTGHLETTSQPKATLPRLISLALNNALFKTTPVNGCLLFGELADDFRKVKNANLFLTFGMYAARIASKIRFYFSVRLSDLAIMRNTAKTLRREVNFLFTLILIKQ